MRMQIRCCCRPEIVIGTVDVPDNTKKGDQVTFTTTMLETVVLTVDRINCNPEDVNPYTVHKEPGYQLNYYNRHSFLALRSDDKPEQQLAQINGFEAYQK